MNKVIGEFLSEQQSHPTLIARMIYEVNDSQSDQTHFLLSDGLAIN